MQRRSQLSTRFVDSVTRRGRYGDALDALRGRGVDEETDRGQRERFGGSGLAQNQSCAVIVRLA